MEDLNEIEVIEIKNFVEELCKKIDLALIPPITETLQ